MGSSIREFSGLLKISVKSMIVDWSKMEPPRPYFEQYHPRLVMDPYHFRRRKRRSYIPQMSHDPHPSTPAYYNMHPTQHQDCSRKFRAEISQVFQKYPSSMTALNLGEIITVFGSDLLQENTDFFATVQLGAVSCGGAWKVLNARKWDDLSDYQTELLTDGTYLQNCGNPEDLTGCFKPPANRKSSLDRYASCSDRYSYCVFANKTPARLEKKMREFNSCVNNVKVTTPEPLNGPPA